jgi:hypothetical protein
MPVSGYYEWQDTPGGKPALVFHMANPRSIASIGIVASGRATPRRARIAAPEQAWRVQMRELRAKPEEPYGNLRESTQGHSLGANIQTVAHDLQRQ